MGKRIGWVLVAGVVAFSLTAAGPGKPAPPAAFKAAGQEAAQPMPLKGLTTDHLVSDPPTGG